MKKLIFSLILLFSLSLFSFAQEKCTQYKNGIFKLHDPESNKVYNIERRGNRQYEEIEGENIKLEFEVEWLSDCMYTLNPTKETIEFLKVDFLLIVEIIEVKEKSLVLKMHIKGEPKSVMTKEVEIAKSI